MRTTIIHKGKVTSVERAMYRFFILIKEGYNMANKLIVKKSIVEDDWATTIQEVYALKLDDKVVYVQPYIPTR